jgi:hypothetical protein
MRDSRALVARFVEAAGFWTNQVVFIISRSYPTTGAVSGWPLLFNSVVRKVIWSKFSVRFSCGGPPSRPELCS